MLQEFRGWIINICTAVFFITAVEMLLPDNKMRKYAKFVLGLILITVIINPLVRFLNRGMDVSTFIGQSEAVFNQDMLKSENGEYEKKSIENTLSVFSSNLERLCEQKLKEKYSKGSYKVKAEVTYDKEKEQFLVKGLTVDASSGKIERIQKVDINAAGNHNSNGRVPSEMSGEIKDYLSSELKLSRDIISVYKAGN